MKRILIAVLLSAGLWSAAGAACLEHKIWDGILKANVDAEGTVDYDAIRINKGGDILEYTAFLEDADLSQCSEPEKLAFWINGYNAHLVRLVLARGGISAMSEDFKIFGEKFKIASRDLSLNDIEHRVLRSAAKNGGPIPGLSLPKADPRIHFALVPGAVGGPTLAKTAYVGLTIEEQLQAAAAAFANDPVRLRIENGKVVLSTLLKWYADDFKDLGGVAAYLAGLTDPAKRADEKEVDAQLAQDFPAAVDFRFDWKLNSRSNKPK